MRPLSSIPSQESNPGRLFYIVPFEDARLRYPCLTQAGGQQPSCGTLGEQVIPVSAVYGSHTLGLIQPSTGSSSTAWHLPVKVEVPALKIIGVLPDSASHP